ncbi:MAG: SMP-30/gluconolactonase/LRE family protein [Cyclobacteriaceae bacterium]|nr:SMP-30/gluconolactonase/LRE family protein [Cyclobacteriaceae bacterium]
MRKLIFAAMLLAACSPSKENAIGTIERLDPALDALVDADAPIEILAEGYEWSEGPVWVEKENMLLFSDVPKNIVYKWTESKGAEPYLAPSGFTGTTTASNEPGANGLLLFNDSLVLCQHGDRRMARMNASLSNPKAEFTTIAATYNDKRFSSPNDAAYNTKGELFFTDPPYGLPQNDEDPAKEQPYNGVYKVSTTGTVYLLVDSLTRPNGIIVMPDQKKIIVANSDPQKATWYEFELTDDDSVTNARIFYDATSSLATDRGLPDGLKADSNGNIFATGPGGIWIFNSTGKLLGKIRLTQLAANCALSPDEKTLYITADMYLVRVKLRN